MKTALKRIGVIAFLQFALWAALHQFQLWEQSTLEFKHECEFVKGGKVITERNGNLTCVKGM